MKVDRHTFPWHPSRDNRRTEYVQDRWIFIWQPSRKIDYMKARLVFGNPLGITRRQTTSRTEGHYQCANIAFMVGPTLKSSREIKLMPITGADVTGPIPAGWSKVMAELSLECLPLEIERSHLECASWPLQQKLHKLSSTNWENEEHFLLHCHALKNEKKKDSL